MHRQPEPEFMNDAAEVKAYTQADFAEVNQAFVETLLALAGYRRTATVLDLGTGPADIPVRLARACPNWYIVALDASRPMLNFACQVIGQAGRSESVALVMTDAKSAGLASHAFDVIFPNSILHHITEVDCFWTELKRLSKPGATLLIRDLARPESPRLARQIVHHYARYESVILREEYYRSLLSAYTPDEVRAQLDRAGLGKLHVAMVSDRHVDIFGYLP